MSTPLKALIQERLRAKMVYRRPDFDLDEGDSDRLLRQRVDVAAYDISSRGDDEGEVLADANSRGPTARRSSAATYPTRLHTHIDPSAYVVDDRYYPTSASYGSSKDGHGGHNHHHYSRYPREEYRDTDAYDPPSRLEQQQQQPRDHRRRHHGHHRVREQEQPVRYEAPSRGGYLTRQPSQSRAPAVSPWHRTEHSSVPTKGRSMVRSPIRAVLSPRQSPPRRGHRKQDFDCSHNFNDGFARHHREPKSLLMGSTRFCSSGHKINHQDYFHNQRYTWKNRHEYSNQFAYEALEPSPTQHPDHSDYTMFEKPVRHSLAYRSHPNQIERGSAKGYQVAISPSPHKPQPKEIICIDDTDFGHESERRSPPQLDMEIIDPPTKTIGRTRAWDDIMSPESRLAARAFVEKRQRRTEKSTPRTMATQRWLEVIDARANQHA
ncbi:unnamed protein product [Phytophthora fragariaefolia]|uniref:Unnamed protein product n=1 Tax=Phytophthora fragariaefolia TaxID=1490495 RepID=A0A9W7CTP2_9STRA|nr:unnamed protein product [Phytophthora fragariaefolia]